LVTVTVTVTVTEAFILRPLLEDRGHITESIRILVPVDRMKQKCFQITKFDEYSTVFASASQLLQWNTKLLTMFIYRTN